MPSLMRTNCYRDQIAEARVRAAVLGAYEEYSRQDEEGRYLAAQDFLGLLEHAGEAARNCPGILRRHEDQHIVVGILGVYHDLGLVPSAVVQSLWDSDDRAPSANAMFPVESEAPGVCEFCVVPAQEPLRGMRYDVAGDQSFCTAVEDAVSWFERHVGGRGFAGEFQVEVMPNTVRPGSLRGASCGLAALVALGAFYLRRTTVARTIAFSACIAGDKLRSVGEETLVRKLAALQSERPSVQRLFVEKGQEDLKSTPRCDGWLDPRDALDEVFPGFRHQLLRSGAMVAVPSVPASEPDPSFSEIRLRLTALMVAAPGPIPEALLDRALRVNMGDVALQGVSPSRELRLHFNEQAGRLWPRVVLGPFGYRFASPEDDAIARLDVDATRLRDAHVALATACGTTSSTELGLGDAERLARWYLHAWHSRDPEARRNAIQELSGQPGFSGLQELLNLLATGAGDSAASLEEGILGDLEACQGLDTKTFLLALLIIRMPSPVARLARGLLEAKTSADRALALQAVAETILALVASIALAIAEPADSSRNARNLRLKLAHRPNLGDYARAVGLLKTIPGTTVSATEASLRQRLANWIGRQGEKERLEHLAQDGNHLLHGISAWPLLFLETAVLVPTPAPGAAGEESVDREARASAGLQEACDNVIAIVRAIGPIFRDHPLLAIPVGDSESPRCAGMPVMVPSPIQGMEGSVRYAIRDGDASGGLLDLEGLLLPLEPANDLGTVGFYRGGLGAGHRVRWWGLENPPRDRHALVEPGIAIGDLLSDRSALLRCARAAGPAQDFVPDSTESLVRPPIARWPGRLPTPLATVISSMRRRERGSSGERLATLNLGLATLLRLLVFPALLDGRGSAEDARQVTARSFNERLLDLLVRCQEAMPPEYRAEVWRLTADVVKVAWELVDGLHRFEHSAGPLQQMEGPLTRLENRFLWMLERSPWLEGGYAAPELLGRLPDGRFMAYLGPMAKEIPPVERFPEHSTVAFRTRIQGADEAVLLGLGDYASATADGPFLRGEMWRSVSGEKPKPGINSDPNKASLFYRVDVRGRYLILIK